MQRDVFIATSNFNLGGRNIKNGQLIYVCPYNVIVSEGNFDYVIDVTAVPNCMALVTFNCSRYGMCHSGGSKYTLRKSTSCYNSSRGLALGLPSGYKVVFAAMQGYTHADDLNLIRMNGYLDQNGNFTETFGLYCYVNRSVVEPADYEINTF